MFGWTDHDQGRVVALHNGVRRVQPAQFERLRGYWEALRDGGALPARAAVDPRGFADLLESSLLIERIAPGMARIRLAGMGLSDLLGMDLRGMPLSALILPESRDPVSVHLEQVFAGPRIAALTLEAARGIGRPALTARLLLLPLVSNGGTVDRALGCLVTEGKVGRAPRRFGLASCEVTEVADYVAPAPLGTAQAVSTPHAPLTGFAEPPAPFDRPANGRPNLRVIPGGGLPRT
ncbi:MAG: PAS domain-containing protein [Gemmobacter sp.]|nr:PAS domain-containing protein [Gemmobacter sp.]